MEEITDEDIDLLIQRYKNKKTGKTPVYSLKELVSSGMLYLYGEQHYKNGKITPCSYPFGLYHEHDCTDECISMEPTTTSQTHKHISIDGIYSLEKSEDSILRCWSGHNLAVITSSFDLHGYYNKELLFQKFFPNSSALLAMSKMIHIGFHSGEVLSFDPKVLRTASVRRHSGTVTSLSHHGSHLLSSSLDGSIFYQRRMNISNHGVLDVKFVNDKQFICSCTDNSIIVYENSNLRSYVGHRTAIKSLTYDKICISSSVDGFFGLLFNERVEAGSVQYAYEMRNVGCSMHKQIGNDRAIGYGLDNITVFDINTMERIARYDEPTFSLDFSKNIFAYSTKTKLNLQDIRSPDKVQIEMHRTITGLDFSPDGNILLVSTSNTPYVINMHYL
ncbi:hypothetical protein PAEPH01_0055 [Pancytospora epiphaga]|nr:hypothetical protein PAEPH01_0055 [Pancytospora epiphaga]